VVVRPRTLEAVWDKRPTSLVPLVDLDRELVLVPLLVQVPQRSMPLAVCSQVRVAPSAALPTRDLVSLVPTVFSLFPREFDQRLLG
jgi:hypothetical protein